MNLSFSSSSAPKPPLFRLRSVALAVGLLVAGAGAACAQIPFFEGLRNAENPREVATVLQIIVLLTVLSIAPAILIMTTSFTRIIIVLAFVQRALATQNLPPAQVIAGLSLILTFLVMAPTFREIKDRAIVPYLDEKITQAEALRGVEASMRKFMFRHTRKRDVKLFLDHTDVKIDKPPGQVQRSDIPTHVLVSGFVISELRRAFQIGFVLFLPFVIIDLVVASTLISMGMLVLPPIMISLPFKILLFVLVDGWALVTGSLLKSFA